MTQPKARISTAPYIGPEKQLNMPLGLRPLTGEEAVTQVVHELHGLWRTFRHTKLRSDLLRFIDRAVYLQRLGYELVLSKRQDCVCAHRKEAKCLTQVVH